jgi:hypothetical protein
MNPNQLALQYKSALEATGAFVVQPDGSVKMSADRGGGFAPPWVWAGAIPPASGDDPDSQALRIKLSTPASDPSSPWNAMYQGGGPFTKHSAWDSQNGTYEGGTDWGTLLGTIGVGSMFAAPAMASLFGGGGASGAAASGGAAGITDLGAVSPAEFGGAAAATMPTMGAGSGVAGAVGSAATAAGGKAINPIVGALTSLASALGGKAIASATGANNVPPQLSQLLDMAVQRQQQQRPIGQAVDQGIYQMLPNFAKTGTSMPNVPSDPSQGLAALFGGK